MSEELISEDYGFFLQKEDLARMYRLFHRIPKGLDPVAEAFKAHVESEGSALVKEVTAAAEQKKEAGRIVRRI